MILSDLEAGVRAYHDALREHLPVLKLAREPEPGTVAAVNARLAGDLGA